MQTIFVSLPIFIIIFLGFLTVRLKIAEEKWVSTLNTFVYYIALPALIVTSFWQIDFSKKAVWLMVFELIVINVVFCFILMTLLKSFKVNKNLSATILLGSMIGNCVFIGIPIVEMSYGKIYLPETVLMGTFVLVISIILVIIFIEHNRPGNDSSLKRELRDFLKNPLVLALVAGIILSFFKLENPILDGIKKSIAMLGATASPIALFSLGIFMYGKKNKKIKLSLLISGLKMILFPTVAILISVFIFKQTDIKVLALISAMPVAVTTFSIAEKFKLDQELIGSSIIVSTLLVFIIAPIIILLFP